MELSYFLAQLLGLTLMLFAAMILLRPTITTVAIRDLRAYSFEMLLAGFLGIVGGLAVVLSHNIWEFSWRGIITLMGWAALLKGISYVAFPNFMRFTAASMLNGKRKRTTVLIVVFLLGSYLVYHGFGIAGA